MSRFFMGRPFHLSQGCQLVRGATGGLRGPGGFALLRRCFAAVGKDSSSSSSTRRAPIPEDSGRNLFKKRRRTGPNRGSFIIAGVA